MSKKISLIHANDLASVDYAYASRMPADMDLLFMAGACPLDKSGEISDPGDYEKQAIRCVSNLREALKECEASLDDIV